MNQGVVRRPKKWVDSEAEQPVEGNEENNEVGGNVNAMVQQQTLMAGNIVQHTHAQAGTIVQQGISTRRYGVRGPVISNERAKQPPVRGPVPSQVRGPAPPQTTTPRLIRVPYPGYEASGSSQPRFMEFIPTPRLPPKKP